MRCTGVSVSVSISISIYPNYSTPAVGVSLFKRATFLIVCALFSVRIIGFVPHEAAGRERLHEEMELLHKIRFGINMHKVALFKCTQNLSIVVIYGHI